MLKGNHPSGWLPLIVDGLLQEVDLCCSLLLYGEEFFHHAGKGGERGGEVAVGNAFRGA